MISCNQCSMVTINGMPCHETGCTNSRTWSCSECGDDNAWKEKECVNCAASDPFSDIEEGGSNE